MFGRTRLTKIVLGNFKAFRGLQEAPLSMITLIYGPNSAGKSSLIQALRLLKQNFSHRTREPWEPVLLTKGDEIDLGSFENLISDHDLTQNMAIGVGFMNTTALLVFRWSEKSQQAVQVGAVLSNDTEEYRLQRTYLPEHDDYSNYFINEPYRYAGISEVFSLVDDRLTHPFHFTIDGFLPETVVIPSYDGAKLEQIVDDDFEGHWDSEAPPPEPTYLQGLQGRFDPWTEINEIPITIHTGEFSPGTTIESKAFVEYQQEARRRYVDIVEANGHIVNPLLHFLETNILREAIMDISELKYLGPLRHLPERLHFSPHTSPRHLGERGQHLIDLLANTPQLLDDANGWLDRLQVPYRISIHSVSTGLSDTLIRFDLIDRRTGVIVGPSDVGFGISQLLPVVIACCQRQSSNFRDSPLCIEQPEIHVHPRLQAEIADLFIENATHGSMIIAETHSEHLLLRLQRRIREGAISNESVSVLYVDSLDDGSAVIKPIRLDTDGSFLDEWPGGFFEERYNEMFGA